MDNLSERRRIEKSYGLIAGQVVELKIDAASKSVTIPSGKRAIMSIIIEIIDE